jgi:hypothetical protein
MQILKQDLGLLVVRTPPANPLLDPIARFDDGRWINGSAAQL